MIIALFVLFIAVAATYHLLWESLIAPTIRMRLRFKLFALRDKVRNFHSDEQNESSKSVAEDLEGSLNTAIRLLHTATISAVLAADKEVRSNPILEKKIQKRQAAIENVPELKAIYEDATEIVATGFVVNSGGWFLYLIPILLIWFSFGALKGLLDRLLTVRSYEISAFDPDLAYS